MLQLRRPRRPRRSGEWTADKAVTFIVTLAACGCVTLAARRSGMSRKSAYALKGRDTAFAAAWNGALRAASGGRIQGDKVDEVDDPPKSRRQGDNFRFPASRQLADEMRDHFLARLVGESANRAPPVAHNAALP